MARPLNTNTPIVCPRHQQLRQQTHLPPQGFQRVQDSLAGSSPPLLPPSSFLLPQPQHLPSPQIIHRPIEPTNQNRPPTSSPHNPAFSTTTVTITITNQSHSSSPSPPSLPPSFASSIQSQQSLSLSLSLCFLLPSFLPQHESQFRDASLFFWIQRLDFYSNSHGPNGKVMP